MSAEGTEPEGPEDEAAPPPIADLGSWTDHMFHLQRAYAINEYAKMEAAMARLLSTLLGTTQQKAVAVFFNLINTRFRNATFESLLKIVHGDLYDTYWHGHPGSRGNRKKPGLFALIQQIDVERNQIVHWHTLSNTVSLDGGVQMAIEQLMKPTFWVDPALNFITTADLIAFTEKANFVRRSVSAFWMYTSINLPDGSRRTWTDIFQQPPICPPPDTHPLSPKREVLSSPPRSSPA